MSAFLLFNYRIDDRESYGPYLAEVPKILESHGAEILASKDHSFQNGCASVLQR